MCLCFWFGDFDFNSNSDFVSLIVRSNDPEVLWLKLDLSLLTLSRSRARSLILATRFSSFSCSPIPIHCHWAWSACICIQFDIISIRTPNFFSLHFCLQHFMCCFFLLSYGLFACLVVTNFCSVYFLVCNALLFSRVELCYGWVWALILFQWRFLFRIILYIPIFFSLYFSLALHILFGFYFYFYLTLFIVCLMHGLDVSFLCTNGSTRSVCVCVCVHFVACNWIWSAVCMYIMCLFSSNFIKIVIFDQNRERRAYDFSILSIPFVVPLWWCYFSSVAILLALLLF